MHNGLDRRRRLMSAYLDITRVRPISASSVGQERTLPSHSRADQVSGESGVSAAVALGSLIVGLRVKGTRATHLTGRRAMAWSTSEIADMASTTVNTVRHYHRLGLL